MWGGFQGFDQLKGNETGKVRAEELRAEIARLGPRRKPGRLSAWVRKRLKRG